MKSTDLIIEKRVIYEKIILKVCIRREKMNEVVLKRNRILAETVIKNLKSRHFDAYFCEDKNALTEKIQELVSKEETVSWGGSMTLEETGLKAFFKDNGYKVIDRDSAKSREERLELVKQGIFSDVFFMSSNAISEDGILVNVDGTGNRVSALCYGPKRVIIVAGMNKIVKTEADALYRARNYAAPVNAVRIKGIYENMQTPCNVTGSCSDCKSDSSICVQTVTTRLSFPKGRITVILVNEILGY